MSDDYKAKLKAWAAHSVALLILSILLALVQRWIGVKVDVPPPPPVNVIVQPGDPHQPPVVTVSQQLK